MRKIAIYGGRFQPIHEGHLTAYKKLVEAFGKENVYLVSTEPKEIDERNPFTFAEKKNIINSLFDVPSDKIVKVKNPYRPEEVLNKFDPKKTMFVTAVGEKDSKRMTYGKYFRRWDDNGDHVPMSKGGYYIIVPNFEAFGETMSATKIREKLGNPAVSVQDKVDFFKDVYGKFDKSLFKTMVTKISDANGVTYDDEDKEMLGKTNKDKDTVHDNPDEDPIDVTDKSKKDLLMKKVRNPQTRRDILVKTALNYDKDHPAYKAARKLFQLGNKGGSVNELFESVMLENALINQFNSLIDKYTLPSQGRDQLRIEPSDDYQDIEDKCKAAYKMGIFYYPLLYALQTADDDDFDYEPHSNNKSLDGPEPQRTKPVPVPDPGETFPVASDGEQGDGSQGSMTEKAKSSTERVRKYYRNNREKVRKHLKKTQDDRVARNRDRRKAEKKHGKAYMKDKDVHHPKGPHGGETRVVKKDHGPDKKKKNEDAIDGGLADKDTIGTLAKHHGVDKKQIVKQLMVGVKVEMEHTNKATEALEIAMDHVKEDPNYYTKLKTIEPQHDIEEDVIDEGGAAGHMMHPYEDTNLTFADYKEMINKGLIGSLGDEEPVTEKLDGQQIAFTVVDGEIRFARNKGHVKDGGQNALSVKGMMEKFADRGNVTRAFVGAAKDLEKTIKHMPNDRLNQIFKNGSAFMSTEIILPDTQNVIPYDKTVLVFHGTTTYDEDGNKVESNMEAGETFSDYVTQYSEAKQEIFGMQGPHIINFSNEDTKKMYEKAREYNREVDRLKLEFNLSDDDPVAEYYAKWWDRELTKEMKQAGLDPSPEVRKALIKRFAFGDKSLRMNQIKDRELRTWVSDYQKNRAKDVQKVARNPFEMLFLKVGADSLRRVENLMAANNPGAVDKMKKAIDSALKSLSADDMSEKAERLRQQFEKLEKIGLDKLVPSEGMVFIYKGQPYKFTGTFAPMNQLLGTFKYGGRGGEEQPQQAQPQQGAPPEDDKQFIKQFYGEKIRNPLTGKEITVQSALTYDKSHPAYKMAQQFLQQQGAN